MANRPKNGDHVPHTRINDLYRLTAVSRWHIVQTDKQQSVAEHSFIVTLLAMEIAFVMDIGNNINMVVHALFHDAAEAFTGDIPSPVRKFLNMEDRKKLEERVLGDYAKCISDDPLIKTIVKIADVAEAIKFLRIYGKNSHAEKVRGKLDKELTTLLAHATKDWQYLEWGKARDVLDQFLNGEETTIDDYI